MKDAQLDNYDLKKKQDRLQEELSKLKLAV